MIRPVGQMAGATRQVYLLRYTKGEYELLPTSEVLTDARLRELMAQNRSALVAGPELFSAVLAHTAQLPDLRPSVHASASQLAASRQAISFGSQRSGR